MSELRYLTCSINLVIFICLTLSATNIAIANGQGTPPSATPSVTHNGSTTPPPSLTFECVKGNISKITSIRNKTIVAIEQGLNCHITDTNCSWKNKFSKLHLMYVPDESSVKVVAGRNAYFYELECKSGFMANATVKANLTNIRPTTPEYDHKEMTEEPQVINLAILKQNKAVDSLYIGEEVTLKITGNVSYTVNPLECNAYDGKKVLVIYPLWTNCSSKDHAIMDNKWTITNNVAQIQMFAFKFVSSEKVVIECSAYMCPAGDTKCNKLYECSNSARRRREAKLNKRTLETGMSATVSTSFIVVDRKTDSNKSSRMMVNILLYISAFVMAFSTFRSY